MPKLEVKGWSDEMLAEQAASQKKKIAMLDPSKEEDALTIGAMNEYIDMLEYELSSRPEARAAKAAAKAAAQSVVAEAAPEVVAEAEGEEESHEEEQDEKPGVISKILRKKGKGKKK